MVAPHANKIGHICRLLYSRLIRRNVKSIPILQCPQQIQSRQFKNPTDCVKIFCWNSLLENLSLAVINRTFIKHELIPDEFAITAYDRDRYRTTNEIGLFHFFFFLTPPKFIKLSITLEFRFKPQFITCIYTADRSSNTTFCRFRWKLGMNAPISPL